MRSIHQIHDITIANGKTGIIVKHIDFINRVVCPHGKCISQRRARKQAGVRGTFVMLGSSNVRNPQLVLDQHPTDSLNPAQLLPPQQTI